MTIATVMPKEGQFIATWNYAGVMWCTTYKRQGDELAVHDHRDDEWSEYSNYNMSNHMGLYKEPAAVDIRYMF